MADVPHFRFPFDVENGKIAEVEQDTMDDIAGCVEVVLRTPLGWRDELPEFGTQNPTFTAPLDIDRLRRSVSEWEPRAEATFEEEVGDAFDEGLRRIKATVGPRIGEDTNV